MLGGTAPLGQALGLLLVGGTVKRDVFVAAFPMIAQARHLTLLSATRPTSVVNTRPGPITNPELRLPGDSPSDAGVASSAIKVEHQHDPDALRRGHPSLLQEGLRPRQAGT